MIIRMQTERGEARARFQQRGNILRAILSGRMSLALKLRIFKRYKEANKNVKKISLPTQSIRVSPRLTLIDTRIICLCMNLDFA